MSRVAARRRCQVRRSVTESAGHFAAFLRSGEQGRQQRGLRPALRGAYAVAKPNRPTREVRLPPTKSAIRPPAGRLPERKRVCGNHSMAAVIEHPQSPLSREQSDVHDRGVQGHHRLREGDHARGPTTDPDQETVRRIGRRRWPKFWRGLSPALMRPVWASWLLTASAPSRRGRRDGECAAAKMQAGSSVAQAVVSGDGRTRCGT